MYSSSLESLLKSIKQSTENPAPFKKATDLQSGLPFKLFPTKSKTISKKILIFANINCNLRLVESLLLKIVSANTFNVYYCGPEIMSIDLKKLTKVTENEVSAVEPNVFLMFGLFGMSGLSGMSSLFDSKFKKPVAGKFFLVLEKQDGLLVDSVELLNKTVDAIYVFSEYYKKILLEEGIEKPVNILKLGLDKTNDIMDINTIKNQMGITNDSFILVNPNGNRIDIALIVFAKLISLYPDFNMYLLCVSENKHSIDIFKHELVKNNLSVSEHIGKLFLTTNNDFAFRIANIGINTDDQDKIRFDFLEFISYGKPQVVPDYGFYSEYVDSHNDSKVEIGSLMYESSEHGLGMRHSICKNGLLTALRKHIDKRPTDNKSYKNWGQWADGFIKSLI